jgi:capsular polysaccharide transport system permease protein
MTAQTTIGSVRPRGSELVQGAATQVRVIGALMLRETQTRFGAAKIGFLWAIVEPFCHILAFSQIAKLIHHSAPLGSSVEIFFATGIVPFFLFRDLAFHLSPALSANRALLYFPIVKNMDVLVARALLEIATWIMVAILAAATFACFNLEFWVGDPLNLMLAWAAMGLLGTGFGITSAVITMFAHSWDRLVHMFVRILYVTSGVYFLPNHLPEAARDFIWWFPTFHGVEWFREAFFPGYQSMSLSKPYLLAWGAGLLLVGMLAERLLRKRMEHE